MSTLLYDLYPAEVVLPNQTVEKACRVYVTDEGVIVVAERNERAEFIYKGRHVDEPEIPPRFTPRNKLRLTAHTVNGDLIARKAGGCGCRYRVLLGVNLTDAERLAAAAG